MTRRQLSSASERKNQLRHFVSQRSAPGGAHNIIGGGLSCTPTANMVPLALLAFKEDATVAELFILAGAFALFWLVFFNLARPLLHRLTKDSPWLRAACERDFERTGREHMAAWGIVATKEEAVAWMMQDWARQQPVMLQHLVGALLCVPSVFRLSSDASWTSSLAALGVLCELGFEMMDTVEVVCKRLFKGAKEVPNSHLLFLAFHHGLTSVLGIPMIVHYRTLVPLHWLCFDLQIVAASVVVTEYGRMLDLKKAGDLLQFKIINFIMLVLVSVLYVSWCVVI